jgi:signal transduction histidine kinase
VRWRSAATTRSRRAVAAVWTMAVVSVGATVSGASLAYADGYALNWGGSRVGALGVAMGVTFPVLGAAILTLRPRDRLGWLLSLIGTLRAFSVGSLAWSYHGVVADPGALPGASAASVLGGLAQVATLALVPLLLVWLPDGRVPRSFWWIPRADLALLLLIPVMGIVGWPAQGAELLTGEGRPSTRNSIAGALLGAVMVGQFVLATLALVALVDKLREPGEARQQLKWVFFGAVMAVAGNTIGALVPSLWFATTAGFVLMVGSLSMAVFRHRLWDIDRLIKATIVYGALTGALIGVVAGAGVVAGSLLGSTRSSLAASCAVTAIAVVLLRPVHDWLQDSLDRVFDRGGWEATRRIRDFTVALGGDPPQPGDLQALLGEVLDDDHLRLTYRLAGAGLVDPWGEPAAVSRDPDRSVAILAIGSGSAEVDHRLMTAGDGDRLGRVLAESRVALEHGRMQAELQQQLAALRDSRTRLIEAGDNERRRIERDIHDGAQSQLVALGLELRSGQRRADPPLPGVATDLLDQAVAGIQATIAELRRFAQGVISPLLVSNGLGAAVTDLTSRLPATVVVDIDIPTRHSGPVESALWYVTCEATTNALKHAPGAPITISIRGDGHGIRAEVSDMGPGGANCADGSGLRGLVDRVEAANGRLEVISPAGSGTMVRAVFPSAS